MKNSFIMHSDYKEHLALLSFDQKGRLLDALFDYQDGADVETATAELDGMAKMAFSFIKSQMDRETARYEAICEKRKAAGLKGGAPKGNTNASKQADDAEDEEKQPKQPNGCENNQNNQMVIKTTKNNQKQTKQPDNDNDNDNDIDTIKRESIERKNAAEPRTLSNEIPTLDDVKQECIEKQYDVEPEVFYNFNASKGWMIGNVMMQDWKAALAAWDAREKQDRKMQKQRGGARNFIEFPQNAYDYDELEEQLLDN